MLMLMLKKFYLGRVGIGTYVDVDVDDDVDVEDDVDVDDCKSKI